MDIGQGSTIGASVETGEITPSTTGLQVLRTNAAATTTEWANEQAGGKFWSYGIPFTVNAGTWGVVIDTVQMYARLANGATHALNDEIQFTDYIPAGTFTFSLLTSTETNRGKLHLIIDGVDVGQWDCYKAVGVVADRVDMAGIVIATPGVKTIKLKVASKNGASSSYYMDINGIQAVQTA